VLAIGAYAPESALSRRALNAVPDSFDGIENLLHRGLRCLRFRCIARRAHDGFPFSVCPAAA